VLLALLVLAACGGYSSPRRDSPSAILTVTSNRESNPFLSKNAVNRYSAYSAASCAKGTKLGALASFHVLAGQPTRELRIEAGARLYIRAETIGTDALNPVTKVQHHCVNLISFVPETGHRYSMLQTVTQAYPTNLASALPANLQVAALRCEASILDEESGEAPATFERHQFASACRKY
jgi:hypothetical protein